jgi:hypothetical protein
MRTRVEVYPAFQAVALNVGGNKDFQTEFPLGEGWLQINLRLLVAFVVGTGTGVLTQAMARILENVLIDTDRDGIIVNASGRMLYQRATDLLGAVPNVDLAFAASNGTYDISIPIHFADPRTKRPEDSILDTSRYNRVRMTVSLGGVSRLLSTVGTSSITSATLSCEIVRYRGVLEEGLRPNFVPLLDGKMVIDPNTQQFVELPRSPDLGLKRIALFCSDNSTQGQGTADDAVLNLVSIEDQDGFAGWNQRLDSMIAAQNKELYGLEARQAGRYVHDYVGVGASTLSAEFSGNKSKYRVTWSNDTPAGKFVHLFVDGLKTLKPAA